MSAQRIVLFLLMLGVAMWLWWQIDTNAPNTKLNHKKTCCGYGVKVCPQDSNFTGALSSLNKPWDLDGDGKVDPNYTGSRKIYFNDDEKSLKAEISYVNGLEDGLTKFYFGNGKLFQTFTYMRGIEHGPAQEYNLEGQLVKKANYAYGKLDGEEVCYGHNQVVRSKTPYVKGQKHGEEVYYGQNQVVISKTSYVEGQKHGTERYWSSKGRLTWEKFYKRGVPVATHRSWSDLGELSSEQRYKNGQVVFQRNFGIHGKLTYEATNEFRKSISFDQDGRKTEENIQASTHHIKRTFFESGGVKEEIHTDLTKRETHKIQYGQGGEINKKYFYDAQRQEFMLIYDKNQPKTP